MGRTWRSSPGGKLAREGLLSDELARKELTAIKPSLEAEAKRVKATVNLKGLPAGRVTVKITAVMSNGRKAVSKRTYKTCAATPKPSPKRKR